MINRKTCGTCGFTFDAGVMGFSWDCPQCKVREESERAAERRHRESERSAAERQEQSERTAERYGESAAGGSSYARSVGGSSGVPAGSTSDLIGWGGCIGPVFGVFSGLIVWAVGGVALTTFERAAEVGIAVGVTMALLFLAAAVRRVIREERASGRTNHSAHAFLTLITSGLWLPIWIGLAVFRRRR